MKKNLTPQPQPQLGVEISFLFQFVQPATHQSIHPPLVGHESLTMSKSSFYIKSKVIDITEENFLTT